MLLPKCRFTAKRVLIAASLFLSAAAIAIAAWQSEPRGIEDGFEFDGRYFWLLISTPFLCVTLIATGIGVIAGRPLFAAVANLCFGTAISAFLFLVWWQLNIS